MFHKYPSAFQLSEHRFSSGSKQDGERQEKSFNTDKPFAISTIIPCGFWSSGPCDHRKPQAFRSM